MSDGLKKMVLTSPCLPKKSFHCGNAVSQIISEILFSFFAKYHVDSKFLFVQDAWNLHGLPFERMYSEKKGENASPTYEEIKSFAEGHISFAKEQKLFFAAVQKWEEPVVYRDTDSDFIDYCINQCHKLVGLGYVKKIDKELILDFSLFELPHIENALGLITVYPEYYKKTIENDSGMINGYPITKKRLFAPQIEIDGEHYSINPIFQSFMYPSYICQKFSCEYPAYVQTSGRTTLKWHFIRNVISRVLFGVPAYQNLVLHGSVLGTDGKRMSKHSSNVVQPSDLYSLMPDTRFVRHVLMKSISEKDISLQVDASYNEFVKVKDRLDVIENGHFYFSDEDRAIRVIADIKAKLGKFKIKQAFEEFYLQVRKVELRGGVISKAPVCEDFMKLHEIFYGKNR